jgi:deoxyribodipyrimidine photo-lyase
MTQPCDVPVFLEELIVRRELAYNYVWFKPHTTPLKDACLGSEELSYHEQDRRPVLYTFAELSRTDP